MGDKSYRTQRLRIVVRVSVKLSALHRIVYMFIAQIAARHAVSLAFYTFGFAANQAATPVRPHFLCHATIERKDEQVSVLANNPRPLDQAVVAIRREYGLIVAYEDPPYDSQDLVDDTDPGWRVAHPDAKGVTRVAGGLRFGFLQEHNIGICVAADHTQLAAVERPVKVPDLFRFEIGDLLSRRAVKWLEPEVFSVLVT